MPDKHPPTKNVGHKCPTYYSTAVIPPPLRPSAEEGRGGGGGSQNRLADQAQTLPKTQPPPP